MSKPARDWFKRQKIEDDTLRAVLDALTRAADDAGCCTLPQSKIAAQARRKERATRNALGVLERLGVIKRERRSAWGKAGRASDVTLLSMHLDFTLTVPVIQAARDAGAPSGSLPARDAGAPSGSRIMKSIYGNGGAEIHRCVGRVFFESDRGLWRAKFALDGVDLDLGRHETKDLAEAEIHVCIRDVEHAAAHKSGTPLNPSPDPSLQNLQGAALSDFLFGTETRSGRAAGRMGSGEPFPGRGCGGEAPASQSDTALPPRARGAA